MARILATIALLLPCAVVAPTSPPPPVTCPRVHGNAASTPGPGSARPAEAHNPAAGVGIQTGRAVVARSGSKSASSPAVTSDTRVASPTLHRSPTSRSVQRKANPTWTYARLGPPRRDGSGHHTSTMPAAGTILQSAPHTHAGLVAWLAAVGYPWQQIATCESLRDDSWPEGSSSTARGVFQFLRSTWRSLGLPGDPAAASWRDQLAAAKRLRARDGLRAWDCARTLGLA